MSQQSILITGANNGIGKITAQSLAKQGAHIIMVCRSEEKGTKAKEDIVRQTGNSQVDLMLCDLSSQASILEFGLAFRERYSKLDVLVNNAGGMFGERKFTVDGLEMTFALNHLGYFLTTHYLLDALKAGTNPRIVNVSSEAHRPAKLDFDNLQSEKEYKQFAAYCQSKLCNILFTRELASRMKGVMTVNCLHPGVVATNFGRETGSGLMRFLIPIAAKFFMISPEKGAATSIHLATSPEVAKVTGAYFDKKKIRKTAALGEDMQKAKQLWDVSLQLTGVAEFGVVAV